MARVKSRPAATTHQTLHVHDTRCPDCGQATWSAYVSRRTVSTLGGVTALRLHVRSCQTPDCPRYHRPYRPEEEGRVALPQHEFGLDVIALVGALRYRQHRSVPEIHLELTSRGLVVCQRTVTNLLDRYDELLAVRLGDGRRLRGLLAEQGRVVLAIDGLQPDVGHEVLWVLRDCLSGEVLLARSLLSSTEADLAGLIDQVKRDLQLVGSAKRPKRRPRERAAKPTARAAGVEVVGVVSDGQHSVRNAVAKSLPGVPHQLCHFHYLREAATPVYEMDRHAKKELKKHVRGVRPIERQVEARAAEGDEQARAEAEAALGYCSAVRSAVTDDGRPPLDASGLKLHDRLAAVSASLAAVEEKGGHTPCPSRCGN
jgi:hypothetical protein